jgi:hypothetical protein
MMLGLMITAKKGDKNTKKYRRNTGGISYDLIKKPLKSFQLVSGFCYLSIKLTPILKPIRLFVIVEVEFS